MEFRALTIWQPWASLIALGHKGWETRSWPTTHRGPLLIHAATRRPEAYEAYFDEEVAEYVRHLLGPWQALPRGCLLALCHLEDCLPVQDVLQRDPLGGGIAPYEFELGDYSAGRWAWRTQVTNRLHPYQVAGRQGLWTFQVPDKQWPGMWLARQTAQLLPRPSHPSSLPY